MIVLNSINVNKEPIDPKRVFITEAGTVMLKVPIMLIPMEVVPKYRRVSIKDIYIMP